jgi:N-methylhydantoinase B
MAEHAESGSAPVDVDPVTIDIVEGALKSARHEMDAVLTRAAMSPVIREQHDEFPMITDAGGRMIVGQFGSYIGDMVDAFEEPIGPGDVILTSDPYKCGGAISHLNDWLVCIPIYWEDRLVGWSSMFGHHQDIGGPVPGGLPTGAKSVFGEGIRIPPVKIVRAGRMNEEVLGVILNNVRMPEMNRADLIATIAGCRAGERRVRELCQRFGADTYLASCQALLDRTYRAMAQLIKRSIPEEPQSFEDWVDDDGLGNGPFKLKLTVWREGEHAYFDWSGTDPQAAGPINFFLNEAMLKMQFGVYLIMVYDPDILFNDGFYPLLHVFMPKGSLVQPHFPAALGCRTHALTRLYELFGGALGRSSPQNMTAGASTSPYMLYSGWDGRGDFFFLMEICYCGIPGRPIGDGIDGHSWWPLFQNIPTEYLEAYYPVRIDGYTSLRDSGGAGLHRGGNGIEKRYVYLEDGEISIHDDRWLTYPWGVLGGRPAMRCEKILLRTDGSRQQLPAKCDEISVKRGDTLIYRTAGGGGWGDPLERPQDSLESEMRDGLVSAEKARAEYGVVVGDPVATEQLRQRLRRERGEPSDFDFGPPIEEILARAKEETGLDPPTAPTQLPWAPLETGEISRG